MKYAHLFNSRSVRGQVDLFITDTPDLIGATVHSTHAGPRAAKEAARALGAKPWNYIDAKAEADKRRAAWEA